MAAGTPPTHYRRRQYRRKAGTEAVISARTPASTDKARDLANRRGENWERDRTRAHAAYFFSKIFELDSGFPSTRGPEASLEANLHICRGRKKRVARLRILNLCGDIDAASGKRVRAKLRLGNSGFSVFRKEVLCGAK